ncbi:EfeM/EfeO family lipoprotein, partial [Streptomyces sp. NPDC050549]
MPDTARSAEAEPSPISPPDPAPASSAPATRRRTVLLAAGALVAVAAVGAGLLAARGSGPSARPATATDGLPRTTVEVATSGCGSGWTHPQAGHQVFELHNTSSTAAEVYL